MKKLIFLTLVLALLTGCVTGNADKDIDKESPDNNKVSQNASSSQQPEKVYIIADQVNIRQESSLDSKVIDVLDIGAEVEITGVTKNTQTIGSYEDYWYNIKFGEKAGWCFGEFISRGSELNEKIKSRYEHYTESGSVEIEEAAATLLKYTKLTSNPEVVDQCVWELVGLQEELAVKYFQLLQRTDGIMEYEPDTLRQPEKIEDKAVRDSILEIRRSGYNIYLSEGVYYLEPDPDFYLDKFEPYISNRLKDFLKLQAVEVKQHMGSDGGLLISWNELADRIAGWDRFISKYPGTLEAEKAADNYYKKYLAIYMRGTDNTPLCEFKTKKLKDEVRKSYERYIEEYKDTKAYKTVKGYYDILKNNKFQVTDKVLAYLKDIDFE